MADAKNIENMKEINIKYNAEITIDLKDYGIKDKIKAIAEKNKLTTPEQIEDYIEGSIYGGETEEALIQEALDAIQDEYYVITQDK